MTHQIAKYFKTQPVLKAWLFGSYSRNEQRADSDVDILVEFEKDACVSLMKHAGMIVDLDERLHRPVDLVVAGTLLPFARESAKHDKILIYENGVIMRIRDTTSAFVPLTMATTVPCPP